MKKLLTTAGLLLVLLLTPQSSNADPGDPIVRGNLEVQVIGQGKVTGSGIDCPGDCAQAESWRDTELPPNNTLTASTSATGWAFQGWSGACTVLTNPATCRSSYGTEEPFVSVARFRDVMAPSVFVSFISPADEISDSFLVGVNTSDNDRVTKVEYLIDGQVVATATESPWSVTIDTTGVSEGAHRLQARSFDPTGNNGITANWPITIDHTAPEITFNSPLVATNATHPEFSFDSAAADFWKGECVIERPGVSRETEYCDRNEPFSDETPSEGEWSFVVRGFDRAGNASYFSHQFVVDRTAPVLSFIGGPADGSTVEQGNVEYAWSVDDGLDVTQKCSFDGGEKTECDGKVTSSLSRGHHTFNLEVTDLAGNVSTLTRTVTVNQDGDPDPDPNDPNDPDPDDPGQVDRTAPVVKLSAPKQKLKALKRGLRVKVHCSEACSGKVVAKGARGVRFTGRAKLVSAGARVVRLKPNRKAKQVLKASPKVLKLSLTSSLSDPAGNKAAARVKTRVRK